MESLEAVGGACHALLGYSCNQSCGQTRPSNTYKHKFLTENLLSEYQSGDPQSYSTGFEISSLLIWVSATKAHHLYNYLCFCGGQAFASEFLDYQVLRQKMLNRSLYNNFVRCWWRVLK
jgi:hypothetical protein